MFVYFQEKNFTEEEIRSYLKNDVAVDSVDFLIELKNSEACNNRAYLLNNDQMVMHYMKHLII